MIYDCNDFKDQNMEIIDYLKNEYPMDRLTVYMLFHGASVSETARTLTVSRDTVYKAVQRSKELLLKYGLLDTSE